MNGFLRTIQVLLAFGTVLEFGICGSFAQKVETNAYVSPQQPSVFLVEDGDLHNAVVALKATFKKYEQPGQAVASMIQALGDTTFTNVDSRAVPRSDIAAKAIKTAGLSAFPELINATERATPRVRAMCLDLLTSIAFQNGVLPTVWPVLARSTRDVHPKVRLTATVCLGQLCLPRASCGVPPAADGINYLRQSLSDENLDVRLAAAYFLRQMGRKDLLSKELREELEQRGYDANLFRE